MADQVSAVELDMRAIKHETLAVRNEALDARRRTEATLADVQQRAQSMQDARVDVVAGSVASLQGDLEALRSRDSELSRELSTVRDVLPALSGDLGLVVDLLETIRLDARRPATPNPAAMRDSISMVIMPRGWDEPVPWRLPIPE